MCQVLGSSHGLPRGGVNAPPLPSEVGVGLIITSDADLLRYISHDSRSSTVSRRTEDNVDGGMSNSRAPVCHGQ